MGWGAGRGRFSEYPFWLAVVLGPPPWPNQGLKQTAGSSVPPAQVQWPPLLRPNVGPLTISAIEANKYGIKPASREKKWSI